MSAYLSIDRCSQHGFYAVCVGDDVSGRRLTRSKCCGSWQEVYKWKMTPDQLREMANELECAAGVAVLNFPRDSRE